jgi:hypothetical protein
MKILWLAALCQMSLYLTGIKPAKNREFRMKIPFTVIILMHPVINSMMAGDILSNSVK